jgi:hypothetical protein
MIGESVMTPPRFFILLTRMWSWVRRFATAPRPEPREGGISKPFPFFGD